MLRQTNTKILITLFNFIRDFILFSFFLFLKRLKDLNHEGFLLLHPWMDSSFFNTLLFTQETENTNIKYLTFCASSSSSSFFFYSDSDSIPIHHIILISFRFKFFSIFYGLSNNIIDSNFIIITTTTTTVFDSIFF